MSPKKAAVEMVYMCECGKKWSAPASHNGGNGHGRWSCVCGRTLAIRDGVIHSPRVEAGSRLPGVDTGDEERFLR